MGKYSNLHVHATARAVERYSIQLTKAMRADIAEQILEKRALLLRSSDDSEYNRGHYVVWCDGKAVVVVFDLDINQIITFLPKDLSWKDKK